VYANVIEVHLEDATASTAVASYVRVATLSGKTARVSARLFILAGGGLENPRLLLSSTSARPAGLGNERGLVGRFFMEHPTLSAGRLLPDRSRPADRGLYAAHRVQFGGQPAVVEGVLSIAEPLLEERQMLRCGLLFPTHWRGTPEFSTAGVNSARQLVRGLRQWQVPYETRRHLGYIAVDARAVVLSAMRFALQSLANREVVFVRTYCEQAPDPESRVSLSTQRDELGRPRVQLDWRLSWREIETLRHAHQIIAEEVAWAGLGRFVSPVLEDSNAWTASIVGGYHHMGTTRMHRDAEHGVVDEHGRVHTLANVYVAGSSVFPTAGYANPTLTIVALALRLADHVKEKLGVSAPRRDRGP
jgi:choline dehydrogenase-like flavoprotein